MSWSVNQLFRNVAHAEALIDADQNLPETVRDYIKIGLAGISTKDDPVHVEGHGHLCYAGKGGGSYEETSCTLKVRPLKFAP